MQDTPIFIYGPTPASCRLFSVFSPNGIELKSHGPELAALSTRPPPRQGTPYLGPRVQTCHHVLWISDALWGKNKQVVSTSLSLGVGTVTIGADLRNWAKGISSPQKWTLVTHWRITQTVTSFQHWADGKHHACSCMLKKSPVCCVSIPPHVVRYTHKYGTLEN